MRMFTTAEASKIHEIFEVMIEMSPNQAHFSNLCCAEDFKSDALLNNNRLQKVFATARLDTALREAGDLIDAQKSGVAKTEFLTELLHTEFVCTAPNFDSLKTQAITIFDHEVYANA